MKCPNETCITNNSEFDTKKREIIFIRYDDTQMKYLYLCSHCDCIWKTT
jgi:aspartate carbamoyltransferase regulatory subunit